MSLHNAIINLYPNAIIIRGNAVEEVKAFDENQNEIAVDANLVQTELSRLQANYDAKEYKRKRAAEYPPITDYIDGVVKGDEAQVQAYIDACNAVKAKYPKGA